MTCYYPMISTKLADGTVKIFCKTENIGNCIQSWRGEDWFLLPCGKCVGCKLDFAREWACRCVHETQMHIDNCFLTLTYNDYYLPHIEFNGKLRATLVKKHLVDFVKRLRRHIEPLKIKFYACGEYGDPDKGDRKFNPHYHLCIFGYDPPDKKFFYRDKGNDIFLSKKIRNLWKKGNITVGEITLESAGYVARYCVKKITGEMAVSHYKGRTPEFSLMSRGNKKVGKNGIGYQWFMKYKNDVYPKDFFTIDGVKHRPPRYYDNLLQEIDPELFEELKIKRKEEMLKNKDSSARLIGKDKYKQLITKTLRKDML